MSNKFFVVGTPIGNLKDISIRGLEILKSVDFIFCENTLHSQKLLNHYEIKKKKLYSLHKFKESKIKQFVFEKLAISDCALISDSGTPTISDPGQIIINFLKEKEIDVIPIPGASALITALSASGIIYNSFAFLGFIERTENKIFFQIEKLKKSVDLIIFYESPKRIINSLKIIANYYQDDLEIIIARELTKKFEEIEKIKINDFLIKNNLKGEFVVLIPTKNLFNNKKELEDLKEQLHFFRNLNLKDKEILMIYNLFEQKFKKNQIYDLLKNMKDKD
ncbi:Ribosomal RNA small subunit methyltransferase I [Candidatus Hepatoplasma crinochetorum Av]|jgi:16S rRNA (cytidine1402-2'-O)-methyltransferase|uniref:Ribosomal RNA small subunit methyltransferase I n=1 Tax=Candidatus Hepatoplasma crinochetorum Av TaxID=1427984 RepID=W8GFY4_9MOLU|nr:16S rRNA (cytidine(1402)-2'-O)-methyltransferase [Candidatus Hepatoplasma crinochetorum]AHK22694.1 Ribosomal RNA small subunit methyltransferase I [Candidatus Hepatoplasma crinochetorum Av]